MTNSIARHHAGQRQNGKLQGTHAVHTQARGGAELQQVQERDAPSGSETEPPRTSCACRSTPRRRQIGASPGKHRRLGPPPAPHRGHRRRTIPAAERHRMPVTPPTARAGASTRSHQNLRARTTGTPEAITAPPGHSRRAGSTQPSACQIRAGTAMRGQIPPPPAAGGLCPAAAREGRGGGGLAAAAGVARPSRLPETRRGGGGGAAKKKNKKLLKKRG